LDDQGVNKPDESRFVEQAPHFKIKLVVDETTEGRQQTPRMNLSNAERGAEIAALNNRAHRLHMGPKIMMDIRDSAD